MLIDSDLLKREIYKMLMQYKNILDHSSRDSHNPYDEGIVKGLQEAIKIIENQEGI